MNVGLVDEPSPAPAPVHAQLQFSPRPVSWPCLWVWEQEQNSREFQFSCTQQPGSSFFRQLPKNNPCSASDKLRELRVFIPGAAELTRFEFSAPGSPRDQREFWSCVLWLRAAQESEHLQSKGIFSLLRSTEGWMERPQMSAENSPGIWSPRKCHWNGTEDVSNCYTMKTEGSSTCLLLPGLIDGDPTSPERGRMAGPVCHYWMG